MFCYQCEQTSRTDGVNGCASAVGNCGKDAQTSDLQDLLIHAVKGIAQYAKRARDLGAGDNEAGRFILYSMFTTLTNVNFNPARFTSMLVEADEVRARVKKAYEDAAAVQGVVAEHPAGAAAWTIPSETNELLAQAEMASVRAGEAEVGEDIVGIRALILYGAKGVCAYAYHALLLDHQSDEVYANIENTMDFLASDPTDVDALVGQALALGNTNLTVMGMLDAGRSEERRVGKECRYRWSPYH